MKYGRRDLLIEVRVDGVPVTQVHIRQSGIRQDLQIRLTSNGIITVASLGPERRRQMGFEWVPTGREFELMGVENKFRR